MHYNSKSPIGIQYLKHRSITSSDAGFAELHTRRMQYLPSSTMKANIARATIKPPMLSLLFAKPVPSTRKRIFVPSAGTWWEVYYGIYNELTSHLGYGLDHSILFGLSFFFVFSSFVTGTGCQHCPFVSLFVAFTLQFVLSFPDDPSIYIVFTIETSPTCVSQHSFHQRR